MGKVANFFVKVEGRNRAREVLAQKAREILKYKPSVYGLCYDGPRAIFIHIPKCAGTSIAHALYGHSCWHWTAEDLRFINREKFDSYLKFSIVRNPWSRLFSAFSYASVDVKRYGRSPLAFMVGYDCFENFVMHGLTEEIARGHYFLGRQINHLAISGQLVEGVRVDRLEELDAFASTLATELPQLATVPGSIFRPSMRRLRRYTQCP